MDVLIKKILKDVMLFGMMLFYTCSCSKEHGSQPFAIIDGNPLTADEVRDAVLVQAKMMELAHQKVPEGEFVQWANAMAMQNVPGFISAQLWMNEIERLGEQPEVEDESLVLKEYNNFMGISITNLNELASKFGPLESAFRKQFNRSCQFKAYARRHFNLSVGEGEIDAYFQGVTNALVRARDIDARAREKADKAWERLKKGEKWEIVAKECSEDWLVDSANESFAENWATVGLDGFDYPNLAAALPTLKVGDYSKPLETDEGLLIVKVIEISDKYKTLARIFFRMAQPVEVPPRESVRAMLVSQRNQESQLALQRRLREQATITYPLGTNFTYKIWTEAKDK